MLDLYKQPSVNQISGFGKLAADLDHRELVSGYGQLLQSAPRRHARGLKYFVGHDGSAGRGSGSNRREEHLAIALWRESQRGRALVLSSGERLELLDYQLPLKARRSDRGVGKADLFGRLGAGRPCVIELKIHASGTGLGDTPLRAWLEGLAYCAIVEANVQDIVDEAQGLFGLQLSAIRPVLAVMATEAYWNGYLRHVATSDWWPALQQLADRLADSISLESRFLALRDAAFSMGTPQDGPRMLSSCHCLDVADLLR